VRLYVAVGEPFDDEEDTPDTAALAPPRVTVFAAWPRSWQRPPAVFVALSGRRLIRTGRSDSTVMTQRTPRGDFQYTGDGRAVDLQTRRDLSGGTKVMQLLLFGHDGDPVPTGVDILQQTHRTLRQLLHAGRNDVVGGLALPYSPTLDVAQTGSHAVATLTDVILLNTSDAGGFLCTFVDCGSSDGQLEGELRNWPEVTAAQRNRALLALRPRSYRNSFTWAGLTGVYERLITGQHWEVVRSTTPPTSGGVAPAWIFWPTDYPPPLEHITLKSESLDTTEHYYGYMAGVGVGLGVSLLVALLVPVASPRRPTPPGTAPPVGAPPSPPVQRSLVRRAVVILLVLRAIKDELHGGRAR